MCAPVSIYIVTGHVPTGSLGRSLLQAIMPFVSILTFQEALPYLSNYRNPCWYENITTTEPYKKNFFWNTGQGVYKEYFNRWAPKFKERHSYATTDHPGEHLRCLPLVYQVGIAKFQRSVFAKWNIFTTTFVFNYDNFK